MKITNTGRALRVINARDGERVRRVSIEPGATVDVEPIETTVFKASVENGMLVRGTRAARKADETASGGES